MAVLEELQNGPRSEVIAAAQATVGDLNAQLELERLKRTRREYLHQEGAISKEQLDEVAFNQGALSDRLAAAQSRLDELKTGTRPEQISAQRAVVRQLEASINDIKITIAKSTITAPFSGTIAERRLDEGTVVNAGQPVVRLVEGANPEVEIGVPADVAARLALGSKRRVQVGQNVYLANVIAIKPEVNSATRTRTVILSLDASARRSVAPKQIARFNAPIEVRLYGPDFEQLEQLGNQMRAELSQIKDVIHTRASLTEVLPKLAVNVDEEQARLVGLDRTAIARQLDTTLEGATGGSVLEATEELPVRVRISNSNRSDLEQIATLDLLPNSSSTREGVQTIPLSTVGKIRLVPDLAVIPRRNGQRVNIVQAFIVAGQLPASILSEFQQRLQTSHFQLPAGYSFEFGGESEEQGTAVTNLMSTVGVLGVLIAATLVLTFNSFMLAGSIALIAVLSAGLGLGALWLSGYPFGFTAILGTIGLIGIEVNEATVVLAALQADSQASLGDRKAVQEVVVHATRHMIATTITDIGGFTPLLFDPTGFWNPLAIVIAGGLLGVTLLSLYFVPSLYLLLVRAKVIGSNTIGLRASVQG